MTLNENKTAVSDFISKLEADDIAERNANAIRNKRSTKFNILHSKEDEAKALTTGEIFAKIYRDALPLDESYKIGVGTDLDSGVTTFMQKHCKCTNPYKYISEKAETSTSAKEMCEAVDEQISEYFQKFYESIDEVDADDIDMPEEDRKSIVNKISADMGYDEVSQIINDHVKETVQDEINRTKEEDEHMKELENTLASDETLTTESAIDEKLERMGETKRPYKPTLFNGIMINKTDCYTESGLDEEHIGKKAFFESVKEYTLWDMMATLGIENYNENTIDFIADQYARGNM